MPAFKRPPAAFSSRAAMRTAVLMAGRRLYLFASNAEASDQPQQIGRLLAQHDRSLGTDFGIAAIAIGDAIDLAEAEASTQGVAFWSLPLEGWVTVPAPPREPTTVAVWYVSRYLGGGGTRSAPQ